MVEAAADAVGPAPLTAADLRMIVAEVVKAQPRRDWRTDAALVIAVCSLIVAWLAYQQDRTEYTLPDPPPVVLVVPPPAVVECGEPEQVVDDTGSHFTG